LPRCAGNPRHHRHSGCLRAGFPEN
jgi:hypothetical protein